MLLFRVTSTRDLCHALKEHTLHIEQSIVQGENDRATLIAKNQTLLGQYNVLLFYGGMAFVFILFVSRN